jgi:acetyl esterase/lipase
MPIRLAAALAALVAVAAPAAAQVPPEIAERVRAEGKAINRALDPYYAPQFGAEAWQGVRIDRDIAYGGDARHKLDVYRDERGGRRLPVLLFVHGGGFTGGDKRGEFYPENIGLWAAQQGMIGVNVTYRLAPDNRWPAAAEDLAAALAWTRAEIARFGGDPNRIVLFGHSAGANHVADYIGHPQVQGTELRGVKGAVLLSPFYADDPASGEPHAYYGAVPEAGSARAAAARLRASRIPLFYGYAEYDPEPMQAFARWLIPELCSTPGRCPESVYLKDHNHLTEGMAVGTNDRSLTGPLGDWIARLR